MLILTRRVGESIVIDMGRERIIQKYLRVYADGKIQVGFEGPLSISILRGELFGPDGGRLPKGDHVPYQPTAAEAANRERYGEAIRRAQSGWQRRRQRDNNP